MKCSLIAITVFAFGSTTALAGVNIETLDRNGDRFATYDEVAAVLPSMSRSDFNDLDINDDRRLSSAEVQAPNVQAILGRYVGDANGVRPMSELDADGDSFLSKVELTTAYPGFHATDFDEIDRNNDQRVSRVELYDDAAQNLLGRYESGSRILVSLDQIDADGSGFASLDELSRHYPRLSGSDFHDVDRNNDNRISFNELYALETIAILGEKK